MSGSTYNQYPFYMMPYQPHFYCFQPTVIPMVGFTGEQKVQDEQQGCFVQTQAVITVQEAPQSQGLVVGEEVKRQANSEKVTIKAEYKEFSSQERQNLHEIESKIISFENSQQGLLQEKKKSRYGKKNSESNLVNQIFSYMVKEKKSRKIVQKLLGFNKERVKIFYIFINKIKRINQKYMNKYYLSLLGTMDESSPVYRQFTSSVKRLKKLSFEEFNQIIRILIYNYFRSGEGLLTILQSKKICQLTKKEHIIKLRQLNTYFVQGMKV